MFQPAALVPFLGAETALGLCQKRAGGSTKSPSVHISQRIAAKQGGFLRVPDKTRRAGQIP
jgi:hypothetical protein